MQPWKWCLPCVLVAGAALAAVRPSEFRPHPYDWPQWQGPDRNAISRETGLLTEWPKDGPPLAWKAKGLGGGYSTPSIAAGRVFGMSYRGNDEVVWALDEASGKELWHTRIADANRHVGHGEGSRCTPTVDGGVLYALGTDGDLVCLDVATGSERWHKNLRKDFKGSVGSWGYSESPLIDGDRLVCTPGGKEATFVALDKKSGDLIWKGRVPEGDAANYSSIIRADVEGQKQYLQFLGGGMVGIAAEDGRFLWRYNKPSAGINCSTPVYHDGRAFAAASYRKGGGEVKLIPTPDEGKGAGCKAEEVFFTKNMKNHHGGMVLVDGYLYGSDEGLLTCLDFNTGQVLWAERKPGKGSIGVADGKIYYRNEGGPVFLIDVNPKEYVQRGRFDQPERSRQHAWPHPVVANGKLYLRDQEVLLVYDVKDHQ